MATYLTSTRYVNPLTNKSILSTQNNGAYGAGANGIYLRNNFLYVTIRNSDIIEIFNVSKSGSPVLLSVTTDTELDNCQGVTTNYENSIMYSCGQNSNRLTTYNISDPTAPILLNSEIILNGGREIFYKKTSISGNEDVVFLSNEFAGGSIKAVNVTNPSSFQVLDTLFLGDGVLSVDIFNNFLCTAIANANACKLIDITDPNDMSVLDTYTQAINLESPVSARFVKGDDGVLYICTIGRISAKFVILRVNQPANTLTEIAVLADPRFDTGFDIRFVSSNYAYVIAQNDNILLCVNIIDKTNPKIVSQFISSSILSEGFTLQLSGSRLFVSNKTSNYVSEIDISASHLPAMQADSIETDELLVNRTVKSREFFALEPIEAAEELELTPESGKIFWSQSSKAIKTFFNGFSTYMSYPDEKKVFARQLSDMDRFSSVTSSIVFVPENNLLFLEEIIDITPNRIIMEPNSILSGYGSSVSGIISLVTNGMISHSISSVAQPVIFENCVFINLDSAQNAYHIDNANAGGVFKQCAFSVTKIEITDFNAVLFIPSIFNDVEILINGTASGLGRFRSLDSVHFTTGTITAIEITTGTILPIFDNEGVDFLNDDTSLAIEQIGTIDRASLRDCTFTGNTSSGFIAGFDQESNEWVVENVNILPDSFAKGYSDVDNNGTYAEITLTQNVFADLDISVVWVSIFSEKFELTDTNNGELTYRGVRAMTVQLSAVIDAERDTGDARYEFNFLKNDVVISDSITPFFANTNNPFTLTIPPFVIDSVMDDTFKLQVVNRTNNNNISINYVRFQITQ